MFEKQSYIKDEERKDIPIPGGMLFDKTKTYTDECNVVYSIDGKRLLDAGNCKVSNYYIKEGTEIICNNAFGRDFFQERNNRVELGKIIIPSSVCYIAPSALPNTCSAESYSPFYDIIDDLLIDKRKLSVVKCLNRFKQKVFVGNPIVSIESYAFANCDVLREVSLPDSLVCIEEFAFHDCRMLQEVNLPNSLKVIEKLAFGNCELLSIKSLPVDIRNIGDYAFELRIHDAFYDCKNLKKVVLNARHLDFFELPKNVQIREIGEQVETIPSYFFSGYESTVIEIPHNIKEIKTESFKNCKFLSELSFYCEDIELQKNWLVNCENLKIIKIVKTGYDKIKNKLPMIDGVKYKVIYKHNWGIIRW